MNINVPNVTSRSVGPRGALLPRGGTLAAGDAAGPLQTQQAPRGHQAGRLQHTAGQRPVLRTGCRAQRDSGIVRWLWLHVETH